MLDRYWFGEVDRISPEAPVPIVEVTREEFYPGGAANVARNISPFSPHTHLMGRVGKDMAADRLRTLLIEDQVDPAPLLRLLGDRAGHSLDAALAQGAELTWDARGELALHISTAKVAATRAGLDVCNRLFDVTGARSTHAELGLDRHWRNLRTHTLHDPVQYKLKDLGAWVLKGDYPLPGAYS